MTEVTVNYLAVFLGAVSNMVIGFLWYNPKTFGNTWMKLVGITMKDIEGKKKEMPKTYSLMFASALLMSYILAHFVIYTHSTTAVLGMQTGFWIWLGFIATTMLANSLFAGKPLKLYALDAGYHLVSLMAMGAILATLQ